MSDALKILIVYPWDRFWAMGDRSGVESFYNAAHAYVDHGHDVRVVLTRVGDGPARETYDGMDLVRVPFERDPLDLGGSGPLGLVGRVSRYRQFRARMDAEAMNVAAEYHPDIVLGLGPHAAPVARRAARFVGVPNVTRLFGQALILHMNEDGQVSNPTRFYANFSEVVAFRTRCQAFILHDDGSRGDLVAGFFKVPEERFHFWRDGVDLPEIDGGMDPQQARSALGLPADACVALSVSRLSPEKQLERVIDALAASRQQGSNIHAAFIGDGPDREPLEDYARRNGVEDAAHFPGPVARDQLAATFRAGDFMISCSDRTNMTNAVLEAMAAGLPVVALDAGATSTVVRDGETGLLASTVDDLAPAMTRLAGDAEVRRQLGDRARRLIESEFMRVAERVNREVALVESIARAHQATGEDS